MKKLSLATNSIYCCPKPLKKNGGRLVFYWDVDTLLKYPASVRLEVISILKERHFIYFDIPETMRDNYLMRDLLGNHLGDYSEWIKEVNMETRNRSNSYMLFIEAVRFYSPRHPFNSWTGTDIELLESIKHAQEVLVK